MPGATEGHPVASGVPLWGRHSGPLGGEKSCKAWETREEGTKASGEQECKGLWLRGKVRMRKVSEEQLRICNEKDKVFRCSKREVKQRREDGRENVIWKKKYRRCFEFIT